METFQLIRPGINSFPTLMFRNVEEVEKAKKSKEQSNKSGVREVDEGEVSIPRGTSMSSSDQLPHYTPEPGFFVF
jgi:hypothetical protein